MTEALREVTWYSDAIEKAYSQLRQRYRGEMKFLSRRDHDLIDSLAVLLHAQKINPYNYVKFVFEMYAKETGDVYLNMLTSPKVVQTYQEERLVDEPHLREIITQQVKSFGIERAKGRPIKEILTDYHLQLSAVFRYSMAWVFLDQELCQLFREDAERMMLFEPLYRKLLKNSLPEELTRE